MTGESFEPRKKVTKADVEVVKTHVEFVHKNLDEQKSTVLDIVAKYEKLTEEHILLKERLEVAIQRATDASRDVSDLKKLRLDDQLKNEAVIRNFGIFFGVLTLASAVIGFVSFFK